MPSPYTIDAVKTVRITTLVVSYAVVPASKVWIIRQVIGTNASTASASRLRLMLWGTGGGDRTIDDLLPVTTTRIYDLRARMIAGEQIRASSSVADTVNLTVIAWEFPAT